MDAKSLRIGNLVYKVFPDGKEIISIEKISKFFINNGFGISGVEPIPLTEEWLIKFGFINNRTFTYTLRTNAVKDYVDELEFFFEPNEELCITLRQFEIDDNTEVSQVFIRKIEYVHQLQNLYYSLTGKEL